MKKLLFILLVAISAIYVCGRVAYTVIKPKHNVTDTENEVSVPQTQSTVTPSAEDKVIFTIDNFKYEVTDAEKHEVAVSASENKPKGDIVIPSTVVIERTTYTVTRISEMAF